ncbi:MAG TPA: PAC2 family protein [Dermatophilaceae bacterium]|nr:PAC2 family protein [Dermatophilaceae bacterium]HPV79573.1 PAC2 family protein [Dermatophilaceae bacterium]
MQDPTALYRFENDADPAEVRAGVLVAALGGFVDAGGTQRLLTAHLLENHSSQVVASFDVDQLLDYRGRRPTMTFDKDRWTAYDDPSLVLHRVVDRAGTPFLLLAGPEPDYQWERVTAAILQLVAALGVQLTVSVHGIPMAVPHTRPLGTTPHATTGRLLGEVEPVFGTIQVPGSIAGLLELRLGEAGRDAMGYAVHVPHYLAQADFPDASLVAFDALVGATGLDLARDELATSALHTREQVATELADNDEVRTLVVSLERQYDAFMEGRTRPSLLATGMGEVPSADEIAADVEAFLREVNDEGRQA